MPNYALRGTPAPGGFIDPTAGYANLLQAEMQKAQMQAAAGSMIGEAFASWGRNVARRRELEEQRAFEETERAKDRSRQFELAMAQLASREAMTRYEQEQENVRTEMQVGARRFAAMQPSAADLAYERKLQMEELRTRADAAVLGIISDPKNPFVERRKVSPLDLNFPEGIGEEEATQMLMGLKEGMDEQTARTFVKGAMRPEEFRVLSEEARAGMTDEVARQIAGRGNPISPEIYQAAEAAVRAQADRFAPSWGEAQDRAAQRLGAGFGMPLAPRTEVQLAGELRTPPERQAQLPKGMGGQMEPQTVKITPENVGHIVADFSQIPKSLITEVFRSESLGRRLDLERNFKNQAWTQNLVISQEIEVEPVLDESGAVSDIKVSAKNPKYAELLEKWWTSNPAILARNISYTLKGGADITDAQLDKMAYDMATRIVQTRKAKAESSSPMDEIAREPSPVEPDYFEEELPPGVNPALRDYLTPP